MAVRQDVQRADIPTPCKSCEARHHGLCRAFNASQLAELAKASSRHEVPAGTELSDRENYSIILSGVVKLTRNLSNGRQQIVGFHFAPDFLGRPFEAKKPVKAEAATKVTLCSLPRARVEQMMRKSPELSSRLLEHALDELDEARDWMAALGRKTASEKIASFLLMIARNIDPAGNCSTSFDLPLTRVEIADFLGLTFETVSRELSRLRTEGAVEIANKRHISLESVSRLEALSGD